MDIHNHTHTHTYLNKSIHKLYLIEFNIRKNEKIWNEYKQKKKIQFKFTLTLKVNELHREK